MPSSSEKQKRIDAIVERLREAKKRATPESIKEFMDSLPRSVGPMVTGSTRVTFFRKTRKTETED